MCVCVCMCSCCLNIMRFKDKTSPQSQKNLHITYSRPSISTVPLYLQFYLHGFSQQWIVWYCSSVYWENTPKLPVSGLTQFKPVMIKGQLNVCMYLCMCVYSHMYIWMRERLILRNYFLQLWTLVSLKPAGPESRLETQRRASVAVQVWRPSGRIPSF